MKLQRITQLASLFAVASAAAVADPIVPHWTITTDFAFHAGQTALPAGEYQFAITQPGLVRITGAAGSALVIVNQAPKGPADGSAVVTFQRYGDRYFLSNVRISNGPSYQAPPSRAEREMVARGATGGPRVIIAKR